jgi:Protein of unknown function (DUF4197)
MNASIEHALGRRAFLAGASAGALALTLPGCASSPRYSLTEAIRRMLLLASERAFARMVEPGGFWDSQVARVGLGNLLGTRGDVVSRILTSALFKDRLEDAFADIAIEGSERAAPLVADAVRVIGFDNALDLVRGGPRAATLFLQGEMGGRLIEEMVPELGRAIDLASDPLVGQLVDAITGADVSGVAARLAGSVNEAIWAEIGSEEAAIRADPGATRDPLLIGVFGVGARY